MQTEEPSQFRLNSKAWFMVAVSVLALGAPLAGVLVAVVNLRQAKAPSEAVPETAPDPGLTRTLEDISRSIEPAGLSEDALRLKDPDPTARLEKVRRLAASVGGAAMPADGGRMWVSVPEKRVPAFKDACQAGTAELEYPPVATEEPRVLLEIVVQKEAP